MDCTSIYNRKNSKSRKNTYLPIFIYDFIKQKKRMNIKNFQPKINEVGPNLVMNLESNKIHNCNFMNLMISIQTQSHIYYN